MKKYITNYDYNNQYIACHLADNIVEYLNTGDYDEVDTAIYDEVDRYFIYDNEKWEVMQAYQTADEANFQDAVALLIEELYRIISEVECDDEEEDDEEEDDEE